MAMIVVLGVIVVLTLLSTLTFNMAIQGLPLARHDQDHESALHAAEAGADDYVNHLNANNNYFSFSSNIATLPRPSPENPAFSGWVAVPGVPTTDESFRYSVNNTDTGIRGQNQSTLATGVVYVTSSGMANGVVRTLRVGLRKVGFLDFVYFTDYEIQDPLLSGVPLGIAGPVPPFQPSVCVLHAWEYHPSGNVKWPDGTTTFVPAGYGPDQGTHNGGTVDCPELIYFGTDTINGPVHSNDELHICGAPNFPSTVDTYFNQLAGTSVPLVSQFGLPGVTSTGPAGNGCTNNAVYSRTGPPSDPAVGLNVPFPTTNVKMINATTVAGGVGGCLYTGATTITLHNTGTVGYMDVTNNSSIAPVGPPGFNCGDNSGIKRSNLALASPLFNGVLYVQNTPAGHGCVVNCLGDATVQGTLAGQMSIGVDDNITITGNILYASGLLGPTATDVLGLSAQNNIIIQHPSNCSGPPAGMVPPSLCLGNLTIDAALVALSHSVYVTNYNQGSPMGLLNLNGTLAQEFRGAVGQVGGAGYDKNYVWDSRLRFLTPPYFIDAGQTAFEHIAFSELKPTSTP